jgi:hypothetical protein
LRMALFAGTLLLAFTACHMVDMVEVVGGCCCLSDGRAASVAFVLALGWLVGRVGWLVGRWR